jgi:hypothetical protein
MAHKLETIGSENGNRKKNDMTWPLREAPVLTTKQIQAREFHKLITATAVVSSRANQSSGPAIGLIEQLGSTCGVHHFGPTVSFISPCSLLEISSQAPSEIPVPQYEFLGSGIEISTLFPIKRN